MQQGLISDKSVGEGIKAGNASWTFGEETPKYFSDHVKRSVPFYEAGHSLVHRVSDFFVKPSSICYELGCSTGVLTRLLAKHHPPSVRWVGIDREPNMVKQAYVELETSGHSKNSLNPRDIQFITEDVYSFPFEPSDFMVAYYTIQFIPPRLRQAVLDRVYENLNWGGAFVMFEKVRGPDARFQDILTTLYHDYKLEQGYTSDEILAKTRSLKGILEPFSSQANIELLNRAGFKDIMPVFKYLCFEGFLAIK